MDEEERLEFENVHKTYDHIAAHFSQTRYKPWPVVRSFLEALPVGAVGVDVGCGNGKYLGVNPAVFIVATDRSAKLVQLAEAGQHVRHAPADVAVADGIETPYVPGRFDFAISVAVVHHFATPARRVAAVRSILATLTPAGTALVYVWALEQDKSRRGWKAGDEQDVMVPWVLAGKGDGAVYQRYYHLYKAGEIEADVASAGGRVLEAGYERDNWWVVIQRQ